MARSLRLFVRLGVVLAIVAGACGTTRRAPTRAPAAGETPAAGACATATGSLAVVTLNADTPAPRCVRVVAAQRLQVVNATASRVTARLGNEQVTVEAGKAATIERRFGDYLEDGVHRLRVDGYTSGGAEVWLGAASATTTTTAETTTSGVVAVCSAASLTPDLAPDPGLPAAVAAMRADIARAAVACDYDALVTLVDRDGRGVRFSFGAETDPIAFWRAAEKGQGVPPLRALRLLLGLPHAQQRLDDGSVQYVWPAAFASEHPTDAQLREVAATGLYDLATLQAWRDTGNNYLGYRVLITAGGDWAAFVAGD